MMLSDLSVRRPVFAAVAAIMLCVIGAAAFFALPVRELPNVDPPTVSVGTNYVGASAEVVEERITEVIERQVSGLEGIDRVSSTSRDGRSQINITFKLDRNIEAAANDVRDAVSRVTSQLPEEADAPQIAKAEADQQPIIIVRMMSKTMSRLEIADYADRFLVERFSTVPGVGQVFLFGAQTYSMRVWLNADSMAARGITVSDVDTALRSQNVELPAGALESDAKDFTIRVNRRYVTPADFAQLPVTPATRAATTTTASTSTSSAGAVSATPAGAAAAGTASLYVTRLGDIARIEEGASERRSTFRFIGQPLLAIAMTRQSQANDLQISKEVYKTVEELNKGLPKGTTLEVNIDNSVFTAAAIHEVWLTMAWALGLVALVNFIFLGSWRSALIPSIVAPICILATFIVLAPMGFSINLLTLLALVLAIGLVVDDAIVVVENIQRRIDGGEPPLVAAERGARQVFFAVVATTMVLMAVFAPLMFLPGYIGRLFVELAVTVAAAIFFSAVLALSLAPMLASKLLRPAHNDGPLARVVNRSMDRVRNSYHDSLQAMLGHRSGGVLVSVLVAVLALAAAGLYVKLPKELVPQEDRGFVQVQMQGPEGAGYDYMTKISGQVETILKKIHARGDTKGFAVVAPQFNQFNQAQANIVMKPWSERKVATADLASELNKTFSVITGARVIASVPPALSRGGPGGGGNNGNGIQFIALGNDYPELARWLQPIQTAAEANPGLTRVRLNYEPTSPRLIVDLDRDKAATLGVSAQSIGDALQTMFGSRKSTTYVRGGKEYDVILQADRQNRRSESDLNSLYVRTGSGDLVPLSATVNTKIRGDTPTRQRIDRQRSVTLAAELQPGYTIAEAIDFFKAEAAKQPPIAAISWGGTARDYLEASGAVGLAFALALLIVFLVLAGQFESFVHPAVIMFTVPMAALGGLFGLLVVGSSVNTYSQVGLIILVGIAAKNGILIVEFANQLRDEGRSITEAVIESASLRLRPIVMTAFAAAAVAVPLVLATGPGSGSRRTIGAVIVSGALFSTLLTLFVVPVFYNLLARFTRSPEFTAKQIEAFEQEEAKADSALAPKPAE